MILLLGLALALAGDPQPPAAMTPAEAIALTDAQPKRAHKGIFKMVVVAAERRPNALYLNSSADFRAPDNVTFQLLPSAAKNLEKRLGASAETALIGRTVTVRGEMRLRRIVNMVNGHAQTFNRFQHTVMIQKASEVTVD